MLQSPQVAALTEQSYRGIHARDVNAKVRVFSFKAVAEAADTAMVIAKLPAGRARAIPHMSVINISGSGNFTVGTSGYNPISPSAPAVAEDDNSLSTTIAAGANRLLVGPAGGWTYESRDDIDVILHGSIAKGATIEGTIAFAVS